ncbi:hypothetical protein MMC34_008383 [Xylographa carneopallida]|nr:hypothetical protein [Xylographa carneopallida]
MAGRVRRLLTAARVWAVLGLACVLCAARSSAYEVVAVSGCVDVGSGTTECGIPASVAVHTTGLGSPVPQSVWCAVSGAGVTFYGYAIPDTIDVSAQVVVLPVMPMSYVAGWTGSVLQVELYNASARSWSAPFSGLSFRALPPPTLTSVSGCSGSGSATLACMPASSVLTVVGSGLTWLSAGSSTSVVLGSLATHGAAAIRVLNDSYLTLDLAPLYTNLLLPAHYNLQALPLAFTAFSWLSAPTNESDVSMYTTNALNVSFVPLPAPVITSLRLSNCNSSAASQAAYSACKPGLSLLALTGEYLYSLSVLVGAVPCALTSSFAQNYQCLLPVVPGALPGATYPLTVLYADGGSAVLPTTVAFTSAPSISSVVACVSQVGVLQRLDALCQPGDVLTIRGAQLVQADASFGVTIAVQSTSVAGSTPAANVSCLDAVLVDSETVTCVLPPLSAALQTSLVGQFAALSVRVNATSATNTLQRRVYAYPGAPRISAVSGCASGSAAALWASACIDQSQLVVTGSGLLGSEYTVQGTTSTFFGSTAVQCVVLQSSASALTCVLSGVDQSGNAALQDTPYTFTVTLVNNGTRMTSNTFTVQFADDTVAGGGSSVAPTDGGSASTGGLGAGPVAGVVIGALVLCVVALTAAWRVVSRKRTPAVESTRVLSSARTARGSEQWGEHDALEME